MDVLQNAVWRYINKQESMIKIIQIVIRSPRVKLKTDLWNYPVRYIESTKENQLDCLIWFQLT